MRDRYTLLRMGETKRITTAAAGHDPKERTLTPWLVGSMWEDRLTISYAKLGLAM